MPTSANSTGTALNSGIASKPINNPKTVIMTPAKNGFVIQMAKTTEYGQDYAVATTMEEVTKIVSEYFAA
jgi:hypothetical protein